MSNETFEISRRRLLQAGCAIAWGLVPGSLLAAAGASPDLGVFSSAQARRLLAAMRTLFPHERVGEAYYFECVRTLDGRAAADASLRALIDDGLARLPGDFEQRAQAARETVLAAAEGTPFFQALRGAASLLYRNPAIWPDFGYPGPSLAFGGYVDRPMLELDWLAGASS